MRSSPSTSRIAVTKGPSSIRFGPATVGGAIYCVGGFVGSTFTPTSEVLRYAIDLRSLTQGRGRFTLKHSHYDPVPPIGDPSYARLQGQLALSLAGDLARAGVAVLLGTGGVNPAASRDLPLLAGLAIGNGLDKEKAFEALTLGAARA